MLGGPIRWYDEMALRVVRLTTSDNPHGSTRGYFQNLAIGQCGSTSMLWAGDRCSAEAPSPACRGRWAAEFSNDVKLPHIVMKGVYSIGNPIFATYFRTKLGGMVLHMSVAERGRDGLP